MILDEFDKLLTVTMKGLLTTRRGLLKISFICFLSLAVLSILNIFLRQDEIKRISGLSFDAWQVALVMIGLGAFGLRYLQSGELSDQGEEKSAFPSNRETDMRLARIEKEAELLKNYVHKNNEELTLDEDERTKVLEGIENRIGKDTIQKIFLEMSGDFKSELLKTASLEQLRVTTSQTLARLRREISDLRLRANVNMLFGIAITAGGLWLLWDTVTAVASTDIIQYARSGNSESNWQFGKTLAVSFVPRLSLVIFIEIFAYFFLKLYANGLAEIKYFQNEMTNVESKLIAVEFSLITANSASIAVALESLAKTERNFILEKGQTTVELERAKSESDLTRNVLKALPELFKKGDSK
jgi:hypothetical protein